MDDSNNISMNKRILVIIGIVSLMALLANAIINDYVSPNDSNLWTIRSSAIQAAFGFFQAVFAGIIICVTQDSLKQQKRLSERQNELATQQTNIAKEQKEMTRRQINLALYDKRYKLYRDFQKTMLIKEPPYIHSNDDQKQYCHKCEGRINQFISEIECALLFEKPVCDYIEDTEIMFSAFLNKMRDPKIVKHTVGYSEDYFNECNKTYDDLLKKIQESTEVFKPYLDFSKI